MRKSKFALLALFVISFTLHQSARSQSTQTPPQANPAIRIEVVSEGATTELIELQQAHLLKVSAGSITYDQTSETFTLTKKCILTLVQDEDHSLQLKGEKMIIKAKQIEVQVDGGYPIDEPNQPIYFFSSALRQSTAIPLFRINWSVSIGSFGASGTALYDRSNQTLTEYVVGGDWTTGIRTHTLYSGVTDEMFHKIAERHKQTSRPGDSGLWGFGNLREFPGVTQRQLP